MKGVRVRLTILVRTKDSREDRADDRPRENSSARLSLEKVDVVFFLTGGERGKERGSSE